MSTGLTWSQAQTIARDPGCRNFDDPLVHAIRILDGIPKGNTQPSIVLNDAGVRALDSAQSSGGLDEMPLTRINTRTVGGREIIRRYGSPRHWDRFRANEPTPPDYVPPPVDSTFVPRLHASIRERTAALHAPKPLPDFAPRKGY